MAEVGKMHMTLPKLCLGTDILEAFSRAGNSFPKSIVSEHNRGDAEIYIGFSLYGYDTDEYSLFGYVAIFVEFAKMYLALEILHNESDDFAKMAFNIFILRFLKNLKPPESRSAYR